MDDVLDGSVIPLWVVLAFQVMSEQTGKALPHEGAQSAFEFFDHPVRCAVGLAVDQSDEDDTLAHCELSEFSFESGVAKRWAVSP